MKSRLVNFLDRMQFFSPFQYGFRKGKSTEEAILAITEKIHYSLNKGEKCTGWFIDFRKAFDFVDHYILLKKIECAGLRGSCLNWFKSVLTNRIQQVKISDKLSNSLLVKA